MIAQRRSVLRPHRKTVSKPSKDILANSGRYRSFSTILGHSGSFWVILTFSGISGFFCVQILSSNYITSYGRGAKCDTLAKTACWRLIWYSKIVFSPSISEYSNSGARVFILYCHVPHGQFAYNQAGSSPCKSRRFVNLGAVVILCHGTG